MKVEPVFTMYPGDRGEFIRVREDKCIACGLCATFCTMHVWEPSGDIYQPVHLEKCVECGACWNVCAADAIIFEEPPGGTGVRFTHG